MAKSADPQFRPNPATNGKGRAPKPAPRIKKSAQRLQTFPPARPAAAPAKPSGATSAAKAAQPEAAESTPTVAPDLAKTATPDAAKTGTPDAAETGTPGAAKTGTPDAAKTATPDAAKTMVPTPEPSDAPPAGTLAEPDPTTTGPTAPTGPPESTTDAEDAMPSAGPEAVVAPAALSGALTKSKPTSLPDAGSTLEPTSLPKPLPKTGPKPKPLPGAGSKKKPTPPRPVGNGKPKADPKTLDAPWSPDRKAPSRRANAIGTVLSLVPLVVLAALLAGAAVTALNPTVSASETAATDWVLDNVDRDQRIVVDEAMSDELRAAGWDGDDSLWVVRSGEAESPAAWRQADYVITTDTVRDEAPGAAQISTAIDNSVAVASFGSGQDVVEVRRVVSDGTVLASADEAAAASDRTAYGTQLAANPSVAMQDADRAMLTEGKVDARIISVLGALAAEGRVSVSSFPIVAGEQDRPIRQVALTDVAGETLVRDGERTPAADILVDGLVGRFAPDTVTVREGALVLRYPVDGLLD